MQRIKNFVHRLTQEGAQVIVITENPEVFNSMDKVSVVGEWNDSWQVVDEMIGENRRMLWLDVIQDDIFELDALETYVPAGIMDEGMFWFNSTGADWPKRERQKTISQLKHLVIILGGKDFYTTLDALKNKLPEHIHQDYIICPLSEKQDSDGKFYYKPQALTVILEWPRMVDRVGVSFI
jgi:hypothetical protein